MTQVTLRLINYTLIVLSTLGLGVGLVWSQLWSVALVVFVVGILWGIGVWRDVGWTANLGLIFFALAAIIGTLRQLPLGLMLACLLTALLAWDAGYFERRLVDVEVRRPLILYRTHFLRLASVIGLGLIIGWGMLRLETNLSPVWGIGLGLLIVIGLSRTIRFLRQESD